MCIRENNGVSAMYGKWENWLGIEIENPAMYAWVILFAFHMFM